MSKLGKMGLAVTLMLAGAGLIAQGSDLAGADWTYHQGDSGATRYSTLSQINTSNVHQLERAWTFHTESGRSASAPMVVDSVMYFSAPNGVYALDAVTGEQIWKYAPPPPEEATGETTPSMAPMSQTAAPSPSPSAGRVSPR